MDEEILVNQYLNDHMMCNYSLQDLSKFCKMNYNYNISILYIFLTLCCSMRSNYSPLLKHLKNIQKFKINFTFHYLKLHYSSHLLSEVS